MAVPASLMEWRQSATVTCLAPGRCADCRDIEGDPRRLRRLKRECERVTTLVGTVPVNNNISEE
eukprot:2408032-Pleurochrysis_carterae.AAC.1